MMSLVSIHLPPGSHYVAMGSSFGAGPGLTPRVVDSPRAAGRSTVNYAHLVAAVGGLDLTDVTFSGATTAELLGRSASGLPAQVDAVTAGTRLVTITAGGNDIGYIGALVLASLPAPLRALPSARRTIAEARDPATEDARFSTLRASLTTLVSEIRSRSPRATIVIVDYLTILPPDDAPITGRPDAATADWARRTARRLSETFHAVADAEGCEFLAVGDASRGHHAWAAEPWTRHFHFSLRGGAPYHPNAAGMRAVAAQLEERLGIRST
jgi:lysophospholipase L1-like esterase